jgi:hypothetical protein
MKAQVLDAKSIAGTFEAVTNTFDTKNPAKEKCGLKYEI